MTKGRETNSPREASQLNTDYIRRFAHSLCSCAAPLPGLSEGRAGGRLRSHGPHAGLHGPPMEQAKTLKGFLMSLSTQNITKVTTCSKLLEKRRYYLIISPEGYQKNCQVII